LYQGNGGGYRWMSLSEYGNGGWRGLTGLYIFSLYKKMKRLFIIIMLICSGVIVVGERLVYVGIGRGRDE
jgi:hypothetical protein